MFTLRPFLFSSFHFHLFGSCCTGGRTIVSKPAKLKTNNKKNNNNDK